METGFEGSGMFSKVSERTFDRMPSKILELRACVVMWIKKVLESSEKFTEAFESRFSEAIRESLREVISAALKLMVAVSAAVWRWLHAATGPV